MHAQSYLTLTVEGIISYSSSDHQKKVKKVSVELQSRVQQSGSASHGAADVLGKVRILYFPLNSCFKK